MSTKKSLKCLLLFSILTSFSACHAQHEKNPPADKIVGGPCEGCEAIYEYGNKSLKSIDTLPGFDLNQPQLKITGNVLKKDGKTPAPNVIIYIYHTNRKGIYETKGDEKGWAKRHGLHRGWAKTDGNGHYTFYTFRPGAYPDGSEAEHIHITIKEPDKNEYYLDEFYFSDDPLFTDKFKKRLQNRGGSGIVKPIRQYGMLTIERDLILGLNIPNYRKK